MRTALLAGFTDHEFLMLFMRWVACCDAELERRLKYLPSEVAHRVCANTAKVRFIWKDEPDALPEHGYFVLPLIAGAGRMPAEFLVLSPFAGAYEISKGESIEQIMERLQCRI